MTECEHVSERRTSGSSSLKLPEPSRKTNLMRSLFLNLRFDFSNEGEMFSAVTLFFEAVKTCVRSGRQLRAASAVEGGSGQDVLSCPSDSASPPGSVLRVLLPLWDDRQPARADFCRAAENKW